MQSNSRALRCSAFCFFLVFLLVGASFGQQHVTGIVLDGPASVPVEGASVVLAGTLYGTVTGPDGAFRLGPVPNGEYTLRVIRSGFDSIEVSVRVPGEHLTLRLGKERLPLIDDPLGRGSIGFEIGTHGSRGDPLLSSADAAARRIPGLEVVRYGTALSAPVVRGLGAGHTAVRHGPYPPMSMNIPGVGRVHPMQGSDFAGGTAYYGLPPIHWGRSPAAVWQSPDPGAEQPFARALVETGYQTNVKALQLRGLFRGRIAMTRYLIQASRSQANGYEAADAQEVAADHKRASGSMVLENNLGSSTLLRLSGRLVDMRATEIPGSAFVLDRATVAAGAARLQMTLDRSTVRRLSAEVAFGYGDVSLERTATGSLGGEGETRQFVGRILADLYHPRIDRIQLGADLQIDNRDGFLVAATDGSLVRSYFWPDVQRTIMSMFFTAGTSGLSTSAEMSGTLSYARTAAARGDGAPGAPAADFNALVGGLAASVTHRRTRALRFRADASVFSLAPSVAQLYSARLPMIDGPWIIDVAGNPDLESERMVTVGLSARRQLGRSAIEVRTYYTVIRDFVSARPPDVVSGPTTSEWFYRNGSAHYTGVEARASYVPIPFVSVSGHVDIARAMDRRLDEPVPLAPPVGGRIDLTAATPGGRILLEISSEFALARSRAAVTIGEQPADGYILFHWWLGLPVSDRLSLRFGAFNIFNARFEPNPGLHTLDGSRRIPGPGRSWLFIGRLTL